jgi:probable rRNA maturation factor
MSDDSPVFPLTSKRKRLPDEGTLEVFVADEQADRPVHAERWGTLAEQVLDAEGIRGAAELSVIFVDVASMTELNKRFMGVDGPTDVLSFPLEDDLVGTGRWPDNGSSGPLTNRAEISDAPLLLGDVVICPAVAARNADEHDRSEDDEIALLVVHGILHVLGMDHASPEEEGQMQAKEQSLLDRFYRA